MNHPPAALASAPAGPVPATAGPTSTPAQAPTPAAPPRAALDTTVIYVVAFVSVVNQFRALLGERGLVPVPHFVSMVRFRAGGASYAIPVDDVRQVRAAADLAGLPSGRAGVTSLWGGRSAPRT